MNVDENAIVFAVQSAFMDLLELVERVAHGDGAEGSEALSGEAQRTVLMLIAAIVVSDHKYKSGEQAFLKLLVDWQDKPGGEVRYINQYATEWKVASEQVPRFFHAAAQHDARHGTGNARAMLRAIQLIGNNACISDGCFEPVEHETVKHYVAFLEDFIESLERQVRPTG
jgi:hypothetical protein